MFQKFVNKLSKKSTKNLPNFQTEENEELIEVGKKNSEL